MTMNRIIIDGETKRAVKKTGSNSASFSEILIALIREHDGIDLHDEDSLYSNDSV